MNYDNISFKPPSDKDRKNTADDLTGNSNIMTGSLLCLGQACCAGNTVWNENAKKCDIKCPMTGEPPENKINYNGRCIAESGCPAGINPKIWKNEPGFVLKNFTDAFFDGLKNNATKSMLSKAEKEGLPLPIIQRLRNLQKEKEELDNIIRKYSK